MSQLNWLDRAIGWINPSAGLKRARDRHLSTVMNAALTGYEGASKGNRLGNWRARPTSANAETRPALVTLRGRSRDLVRNNAYARRVVELYANNAVGAGVTVKATAKNQANAVRVKAMVSEWMETTDCDADGRLNFYGLQDLIVRTIVESGEVLIRRRPRRSTDKLTIPLQLQVLEPDFLDTLKDGYIPETGGRIVQGVEFDQIGNRIAYWLFSEHPGDTFRYLSSSGFSVGGAFQSKRIPASEVLHIYRVDRPGQVRGVPWLAPIMVALRDFADYKDARRVREKVAACFAAFIEGEDSTGVAGAVAGVDPTTGKSIPPIEELQPGVVDHLPPGKKVTFATPPSVNDDGFTRHSLAEIASGAGVPYEAMTADLSNVNFSSGRMGWIEFGRNISSLIWKTLVTGFCEPVEAWICQAMLLPPAAIEFGWNPQRREMIDPAKEIGAARDEIRAGLKSWSAAIRERGDDPEAVRAEMATDQKANDAAGLVFDSDARQPFRGAWQLAPNQETVAGDPNADPNQGN